MRNHHALFSSHNHGNPLEWADNTGCGGPLPSLMRGVGGGFFGQHGAQVHKAADDQGEADGDVDHAAPEQRCVEERERQANSQTKYIKMIPP